MKKHQRRYCLILSMLCAGVAQAAFTPNPLVTVASEGVKPRVMLILDNSGSMGWSCRTVANHPTASCLIDAESLYESVVDLANTYREDAYFGIANIEQNMTNQWKTMVDKAGVTQYQTGVYSAAGVIFGMSNIDKNHPADYNSYVTAARGLSPSYSTPLGRAITNVSNYFAGTAYKNFNFPLQYRCQKNHIIMFTDGDADSGQAPSLPAKNVWDTDYTPRSGNDFTGKPWNSAGAIKQNIAFDGIFFGTSVSGRQGLEAAAAHSNGTVITANSLDELRAAFAKLLSNIVITRSGTGGTYNAEDPLNLTNKDAQENSYYSTTFAFKDWTGTIIATNPDKTERWSSLDTIKFAGEGGNASADKTAFKTLNGTTTADLVAKGAVNANHIQWLKGVNTITTLRVRSTPLSDIIGSKMMYAGKGISLTKGDIMAHDRSNGSGINWGAYANKKSTQYTSKLLTGSNDGLYNLIDPTTGYRTHAFLPPSMLARVAAVASPNYAHSFGIDGATTIADVGMYGGARTLAITGYGAGGKGYFAVQLFCDPNVCGGNANKPEILWELTDRNRLGYTYGKPQVVRTNNAPNHDLIVPNGYGAESNKTSLLRYAIDGNWQNEYVTPNNPNGGGLSTPALVKNSQGYLMYAYAGDLQGNLWKFDFTNGYGNDQVKIIKLFTDINGKPITTKPLILKKENDLFIVFGSGKYLEQSDRENANEKALHHVYGIVDSDTLISSDELQRQAMSRITGTDYLSVTQNPVDYSTQKGWYLPLTVDGVQEGDRLVYDPQVLGADSLLSLSLTSYTNVISTDPCLPNDANIKGKDLTILPFTGGMAKQSVIDADGKLLTAGEILLAPRGTAEIRNFDNDGNIINISEVTVDISKTNDNEKVVDQSVLSPLGKIAVPFTATKIFRSTNGTFGNGKVPLPVEVGLPIRIYLHKRF